MKIEWAKVATYFTLLGTNSSNLNVFIIFWEGPRGINLEEAEIN